MANALSVNQKVLAGNRGLSGARQFRSFVTLFIPVRSRKTPPRPVPGTFQREDTGRRPSEAVGQSGFATPCSVWTINWMSLPGPESGHRIFSSVRDTHRIGTVMPVGRHISAGKLQGTAGGVCGRGSVMSVYGPIHDQQTRVHR